MRWLRIAIGFTVTLLTRRQYVRKPSTPMPDVESAPDKTSVFAHPVECFVSNFDTLGPL